MKKHYLVLAEGLLDMGMDVIALCGFSTKDKVQLKDRGALVVPFPMKDTFNPVGEIRSIMKLAWLIRKHGIQILHCHGFRAGFTGRIASLLAGCNSVYTMHNYFPEGFGKRAKVIIAWVEKLLARKTKRIITVSYALKKEADENMGIDTDKMKVIYNGIASPVSTIQSQSIRDKWGVNEGEVVIGTVARLIPSKGIEVLIDAIPQIIREYPGAKFMIIGDGPIMPDLKRKAAGLKCSDRVIFSGYIKDIWSYYETFDIFVLPTLSEGLGLSIIEAMSLGKPVISTKIGGIQEVIEHNYNGYLVTPGDSEELADAILYFLSHPSLVKEYGEKGRAMANKKFNPKTMIQETSQVIYDAITEGCKIM
ncbi:MAG: glycosyltransferase family 4 protein [Clostridiales bacterium]|nr:glycosyltransferase family 4 protein [Clostridiales bacterium]